MKIISRSDIDENKWNEWCANAPENQPFCYLEYLDAVSEELCFVLNEEETGGMALPYFEKLGVKTLYIPVFCRWIDWIGDDAPDKGELARFLQTHFKECDVFFRREGLNLEANNLIFQNLIKADFKLNSQAKRKVKAIEKEGYEIVSELNIDEGLGIIKSELSGKFKTLKDDDFDSLEVVLSNLNKINILKSLTLNMGKCVVGVVFLVETNGRTLYLKGACQEKAKKMGGMYALMNAAILDAFESSRNFDFGGSRIDGVRRFNKCFGGKDQTYFQYKWSKSPMWYKTAKQIKNSWRKK